MCDVLLSPPLPVGPVQVNVPDNGQRGPITVQRSGAAPATRSTPREPESEETKQKRAKLRDLRITLQRVAGRLGTPDHSLVKQIKYRYTLFGSLADNAHSWRP